MIDNLIRQINTDWKEELLTQVQQEYFINLNKFLKNQNELETYPKKENIFKAFELCSLKDLKVVILGQDPYHGQDQAHGLSFSVTTGMKIPPSLRNIYKELETDLNIKAPNHGCLESWAKQGVLLLNNVLTVEKSKAGAHQKKGWEQFTEFVMRTINEKKDNIVFILWGGPAQKKAKLLDDKRHFLLMSPHPSPLSSYRGFFGSRPFSKCNEFLKSKELKTIDWKIT
ncbi:uracil-DNA glycosylase [Bacteriovoracaceae bacterium]|nr:uracil-DNA glycosylase [Bacteriovoracaceae bacterium]